MHDIEWALFPEFPHPSIIEDLVLIPTPADLPRWLELYDADDQTSNRKTSYSTTPKKGLSSIRSEVISIVWLFIS
jgi:hypothetical protein